MFLFLITRFKTFFSHVSEIILFDFLLQRLIILLIDLYLLSSIALKNL